MDLETFKAFASSVPNVKPAHAPKAKTVTAYWNTQALLTALSAAGWGYLAGRKWQGLRSVLHGLSAKLNHRTGEGFATATQIADAAGLSERWTRHCLTELEELDLVTWQRGGIVRGNRTPSYFRINKKVLAALVRESRREARERWKKRSAEFLARLSSLRKTTVLQGKVPKLPALSASPSPLTGEVITPTSPVVKNVSNESNEMFNRPIPRPAEWVDYCPHQDTYKHKEIVTCFQCRLNSLSPAEREDYQEAMKRAEREEAKTSTTVATAAERATQFFLNHYYPGLTPGKQTLAYLRDRKAGRVPDINEWINQQQLELPL